MTEGALARERRRRGYWLRLARDQAGLDQNAVAKVLNLKAGTSVLAWEKGRRDPSASQQKRMADLYGVPVDMFANPKPTDEERVIEARAAYARAAIELAQEDLDEGAGPDPDVAAPLAEPPGRRSA